MNSRNCKCHHVLMREAEGQVHTIACEHRFSDPSKKLMGKQVSINDETGMVRGYDPASKKWWVITPPKPSGQLTTGWYAEDELIVE